MEGSHCTSTASSKATSARPMPDFISYYIDQVIDYLIKFTFTSITLRGYVQACCSACLSYTRYSIFILYRSHIGGPREATPLPLKPLFPFEMSMWGKNAKISLDDSWALSPSTIGSVIWATNHKSGTPST